MVYYKVQCKLNSDLLLLLKKKRREEGRKPRSLVRDVNQSIILHATLQKRSANTVHQRADQINLADGVLVLQSGRC